MNLRQTNRRKANKPYTPVLHIIWPLKETILIEITSMALLIHTMVELIDEYYKIAASTRTC